MLKLLNPTVFCCLNCPDLPATPLSPSESRVCCAGCGAVLCERLAAEEPGDGA